MTNKKVSNGETLKTTTEVTTHLISENSNNNTLLTSEQYIAILKRFHQFNDFFTLALGYLPYPKTSVVQSLITKITNANNKNHDTEFAYQLTYSEVMTLKKMVSSIITFLKAAGFKPTRKITGAIQDDLNALEVHLILEDSGDSNDIEGDAGISPFSNWL